MLRKKIKRYVDRVVEYLPLLERRKARAIITQAIYARLEDITSGMKPSRQDLHMVLREMGTPESLADAYFYDFCKPLWERVDLWEISRIVINIVTVLALVLIVVGIIELVLGVGTMEAFALGLILGVVVVFYQMLMQLRTSILADSRLE